MLFFDSHDSFYHEPAGPAASGSSVTFRFRGTNITHAVLRAWMGSDILVPMKHESDDLFTAVLQVPEATGLLWYDFLLIYPNGTKTRYIAPKDGLGGVGHEDTHPDARDWAYQLTVYQPSFHTPAYMHGANIYQIFPDRFYHASTHATDIRTDRRLHADWSEDLNTGRNPEDTENDVLEFYRGNLNGIREKLPYLAGLGVDVLYLNPIFQASSNHRYDTADYTVIDPLLGTSEEFQELCSAAGEYGIHVMLDGVFSHTGEDSLYFNRFGHFPTLGAYQSRDSQYYDWYTFEQWPDKYRSWWGIHTLPEVRKNQKPYQNFMFNRTDGIVPRWIHAGACGWRLDVADELPMDFLRKLRKAAKSARRDAVVLGEVWEDASNKIAYGEMRCYCTGDTLDSVMNYPLRTAILDFVSGKTDAQALVRLIRHQEEVYPAQFRYALMNLLGSHDRARVLNALVDREGQGLSKHEQNQLRLTPDEYDLAVRRYKAALSILCALPGCPTVYYGDEAGMTGGPDPFCRRAYPWGHEDAELQAFVQAKLNHRKHSHVLRYGYCTVQAPDAQTITIRRYLNGDTDALGHRNTSSAEEICTVRRP